MKKVRFEYELSDGPSTVTRSALNAGLAGAKQKSPAFVVASSAIAVSVLVVLAVTHAASAAYGVLLVIFLAVMVSGPTRKSRSDKDGE